MSTYETRFNPMQPDGDPARPGFIECDQLIRHGATDTAAVAPDPAEPDRTRSNPIEPDRTAATALESRKKKLEQ